MLPDVGRIGKDFLEKKPKAEAIGAMRDNDSRFGWKVRSWQTVERGGRAGYHGAGGYRGRVLQNRIPPRARGRSGVCASVRTHDVSRLRERAEDATHQAGQFQCGVLNGSTSYDVTNYYEAVPSNALERVLWLEADRMRALKVDDENLKTSATS